MIKVTKTAAESQLNKNNEKNPLRRKHSAYIVLNIIRKCCRKPNLSR